MAAQRVRIWFRKGERVRYISHLDVLRYWERVFKRAQLPLTYSQGFTPHPRLAFAAPLPLGFIAEGEIVDATLDEVVALVDLRASIASQVSADLEIVDLAEVPLNLPAPQAVLAWADYRFDVTGVPAEDLAAAAAHFLALATFEWVDERREKARTYDMREGVRTIEVTSVGDKARVSACLSASQEFTVRPEELLKALAPGASSSMYNRVALYLDERVPAGTVVDDAGAEA